LRKSANIVGEGGNASELLSIVPLRPGDRLLLLKAKGRRFTVVPRGSKCYMWQHMVHNVVELTVFLVNLASVGRHGGSCARPGAASRVVALELLLGRRLCADSRARLTEDGRPHNGGRGDVPSTKVPTVLGVTL
jgi:hypothetical protein